MCMSLAKAPLDLGAGRSEHDVPLAQSLRPTLAEHIRRYPPVLLTLPWKEPDGDPLTFSLIVTRPDGRP